jgi:pimeloyl-ACP methyl ester carboxylesterase
MELKIFWIYQIGIAAVTIIVAGLLYQSVSTLVEHYRYPPKGRLVSVGSHKLHIHSSGEGGPTVVLDAGLGGTSLGWCLVQKEVSKFTRVCSYDRAGYAWSEESQTVRTSHNIAKELYTLLQNAGISGPYILVGHSFGGSNLLQFASLYPKEVVGVILVDSVHEEMLEKLPHTEKQGLLNSLFHHPKFQCFLSLIGFKRLFGPSDSIKKMFEPLPEDVRLSYLAHMNSCCYIKTVSREMKAFAESLIQMKAIETLKETPIIVITADQFADKEEGEVWKILQNKHLGRSNRTKQVIAEQSDHMIHHHQPEIIIEAIREIYDNFLEVK